MLDLLETLFTPCPRYARIMGYLHEIVGIRARYRRCRADWQPHLDRSQEVIRRAIHQSGARRTAVILGSGRLYDVPLADLAASFRQVLLVDVVHPLPARRQRRRWPNVRLVEADVTGVAEQVLHLARAGGPLPTSRPTMFLDDPDVDLVASVNLLSQLPWIPSQCLRRWNRYTNEELERFARHLIEAHLDYLARFRAAVCLIADEAYLYYDRHDRLVETAGALHGAPLPWPGEEWTWRLVPSQQNDGKTSIVHRVRGMIRPAAGGLA